jgi:hypothetical protein
MTPTPVTGDESVAANGLRSEKRLDGLLWARFSFTHSERRGKNTHTVEDRTIHLNRALGLKAADGRTWYLDHPGQLVTPREISFPATGIWSRLSSRSRTVRVSYFNPREVHAIGVVGQARSGGWFLTRGEKPLAVSELPMREWRSALFWAFLVQALVLVYFVGSLFLRLAPPLKDRFEGSPGAFFVFDVTGGPEIVAIVLFVIYGIGWAVFAVNLPLTHGFEEDIRTACCMLGFFFLVHMARSVECFLVANRNDGYLHRISRGFFGQTKERVRPLAALKPFVAEVRGSKGAIRYQLKDGDGNGAIVLSDTCNSSSTPDQVLEDFEAFLRRPAETREQDQERL